MVAVARLRFLETFEAATEPLLREVQRALGIGVVGVAGAAFVKGHDDVRADGALNVHHTLGREEMLAAVDMRAELRALGRQLAAIGQRKDLEAAAIRQYRAAPTVEAVQSTGALECVDTRAEVEMIRIS